ncbi:MAG: hypothetical protein JXQ90_17925 [Cyclobacteriaceae bacterium]
MISASIWFWLSLMGELKQRGNLKRESGAFLLGKKGSNRIVKALYYNDLDPECLNSGIVEFSYLGQMNLSDYCIENNMKVLADVHTHPGGWTGQSVADKTNPMISRKGHQAIIIPNYAKKKFQLFQGVGFYEYLGDFRWLAKCNLKLSLL